MFTMVVRIILFTVLLCFTECIKPHEQPLCLTGYMTEVQSWVDDKGVLTAAAEYKTAIDLSANTNPVPVLQQKMTVMRATANFHVRYLSMARCRLTAVPGVFQFRDSKGRNLAETVEYITFFGNQFSDISAPGELYDVSLNATQKQERAINAPFQRAGTVTWSSGFKETEFPVLKELDLRACAIQIINENIFEGMPNLEALYIGENEVFYIDGNAFAGLNNLIHLDFSMNVAYDEKGNLQTLTTENVYVFQSLKNMSSLDLSYTTLTRRHTRMLQTIGPQLTRLSLCQTGLTSLDDEVFNRTSLRILDLSGNYGIFNSGMKTLSGLEETLQILYARDTGLRTIDIFKGFHHLEVLDISVNEISTVSSEVTQTLKSLQILDLDKNRVTSWFTKTFSYLPLLKLLSLRNNNINLISEDMIQDMGHVQYVAMSGNFIVCNCHTRDFFDLALQNEQFHKHDIIEGRSALVRGEPEAPVERYHRGFIDFNKLILKRRELSINSTEEVYYDINEDLQGNFLLLDYQPSNYMCLLVAESRPVEFSQVIGCNRSSRDLDYDKVIQESGRLIYMLITIPGLLILIGIAYIFRRNFRYCLITVRNSTMLSLINKNGYVDDGTIFHYDVFVSYCHEDRNWVLDHLLPQLESDSSISACLHERDFQVGHSILENIVSCMDRSRSIMLIISQRFLLSQWCQFEMHLAQHRLLETRREDLTLVLLEEIPRRLRPNTLHYLMLTKTYIVWPKAKSERVLFWKRIKKSIVTIKQKHNCSIQGVSLA